MNVNQTPPRRPVRDILSFTFLAHLPTYILLSSFYKLDPTATVTSFAIVALTPITPFLLLRKNPITRSKPTPPILQDRSISLYTSLAATSIFSLILYSSYATWLPAQLATHFVNIPDISATRAGPAGWPILFLTLVPAGWAAREFLFAAWARASAESEIEGKSRTSRDGEYLAYVLYRKTWGALGAGTRVLISRTVVLGVMILANTVVQLAGTVKGVDVVGAGVWGGVWAGAALVIGAAFGWMGAVDGDA